MIMMMVPAMVGSLSAGYVLSVLHGSSQLFLTTTLSWILLLSSSSSFFFFFYNWGIWYPERLSNFPSFFQITSRKAGWGKQTVWFQSPTSLPHMFLKTHHSCLLWDTQIRLHIILNLYFSTYCFHCSLHFELKNTSYWIPGICQILSKTHSISLHSHHVHTCREARKTPQRGIWCNEPLVEVPALHLVVSVVLIQVNIAFPIQFNQQ